MSLGLIQNVPTRWVLAFSPSFLNFPSDAPKYRSFGGVYVYLFVICEKRLIHKCMGKGW